MRENLAFIILLTGLVLLTARFSCGCGTLLSPADDAEFDALSTRLALCRKEARDAKDAGSSSASARMKYEDCKRREHIEGEGAQ